MKSKKNKGKGARAKPDAQNVLLIIVDDLRADIGSYRGDTMEFIRTPHLDRFASRSVQFNHAYSQIALCGPSRASLLTGLRPSTLKYWAHGVPSVDRSVFAHRTNIPKWFRKHGYQTYGVGKVFHSPKMSRKHFDNFEGHPLELADKNCGQGFGKGSAVCVVPDGHRVVDQDIADTAVRWLHDLATQKPTHRKPFFVAVGFRRPHLRWRVPQRYWSLYSNKNIPVAKFKAPSDNVPPEAHNVCPLLTDFEDVENASTNYSAAPFPNPLAQKLRQGYWSAVSMVDAQVGKVVQALDQLTNLSNNTIVVITSDHGWQLGEHGSWCKSSNYELSTQVPLWIRDPARGMVGKHVNTVVELIDIFPTLADLSRATDTTDVSSVSHLDGESVASLISGNESPQRLAFSEFPRCFPKFLTCARRKSRDFRTMGYTVRTKDWRYTEWREWDGIQDDADWTAKGLVGSELYEHNASLKHVSPDDTENYNVFCDNPLVVEALSDILKLQFSMYTQPTSKPQQSQQATAHSILGLSALGIAFIITALAMRTLKFRRALMYRRVPTTVCESTATFHTIESVPCLVK
mmetsp:Transcript_15370/g.25067  ORF Transcript_15370/g.25067 Transcript_15370/m.25067 type:complete len:574 (-) Transcript_15370:9-1730(-)